MCPCANADVAWLFACRALARSGVHVVCCGSRYTGGDAALIMENVVVDLSHVVSHCRERLGYRKVVLCGWSGGGSVAAFYQSQAEHPTVTATPAGDPPNLTTIALPRVDALIIAAAHRR